MNTKDEIQQSAVELFKNNKSIALQWATSLGKSKATIDMLNDYAKQQNKIISVLLLVAETSHKQNWKDEFTKWGLDNRLHIKLECYASIKKHKNLSYDIVVLDEAHHINSDIRMGYFKTITANKYILLSATLSFNLLKDLKSIIGDIKTSKIGLQTAFDNNLVSEPKIFTIALRLNSTVSNQSIIEEWGTKSKRVTIKCSYLERWKYLKDRTKYPDIKLIISCTELQKYQYLSEKIDFFKRKYMSSRIEAFKNKWLHLGSERKRYLGSLKTQYVYNLTLDLKKNNKRFICFCSSIEQANLLGCNNAIHSECSNSLNILNKFNTEQINSLYAVGMLQEGVNLKNIEIGIIAQLDGQERAFIQKFGK